MKNIISFVVVIIMATINVNAQVDRSKRPDIGSNKPTPVKIKEYVPVEFTLDNGLKVLVVVKEDLPTVDVSLSMIKSDDEHVNDPTFGIYTRSLNEGSKNISKEKLQEEFILMGGRMSSTLQGTSMEVLTENIDRGFELFADVIFNPIFSEEKFENRKVNELEIRSREQGNPQSAGGRVQYLIEYGPDHPYAHLNVSTDVIKTAPFDKLSKYYNEIYVPDNAVLTVVGNVDVNHIESLIKKHFSSWKGKYKSALDKTWSVRPNPLQTEIHFINTPGATQSLLNLSHLIDIKETDPDHFPLQLAIEVLGGGFTGYLNLNLRVDKAYTYGAQTQLNSDEIKDRIASVTAVRTEVTAEALIEMIKETKRLREEPVTEEVLANVKLAVLERNNEPIAFPSSIARNIRKVYVEKLVPPGFTAIAAKRIEAVTAQDILRVAKKYFTIDNTRIVVRGDGKEVANDLEKLGFPMFYYDIDGNKISKPE